MRNVVLVGLFVPGVALADAPASEPSFVVIDRLDDTSVMGGELTYVEPDGDAGDLTLLRFQLAGRYVNHGGRAGGYFQLPTTYASANDDSETGVGNLEVGALFMPKLASPTTQLVLHAGITLPTGSDDAGALINLAGGFARPADLYLALPQATTLRLGASPVFRSGNVFGRIDVGLDINLDVDDSGGLINDVDPLLKLNAGIGVDLGSAAVMGELTNAYIFSDQDNRDLGDNLISMFALSVRGRAGNALPYAALLFPLDDTGGDAIDVALTLGIEAKL